MGERFIWSLPVVASVTYISLVSTILAYIFWNRGGKCLVRAVPDRSCT